MKKFLVTLFSAVALIFIVNSGALDVSASAATSGTTGDCTWSLNGTVITISGNGNMGNYSSSSSAPWGETITKVIIEDGVTSIGNHAFYGCSSLTSITIPDSVTSIGSSAFYNTAYYNNSNNWDNNVLYIGNYLINAKTSISGSYDIRNDTICIASSAFHNCDSLTSITIPNSVTSIGSGAFYYCLSLKNITIPDSVTSIGGSAFYNCDSLTSITIGRNIMSVGDDAFLFCESLSSVNIMDITSWCNIEFASSSANPLFYTEDIFINSNLVDVLVIPDTVREINDYVFTGCSSFKNVIIPNSVTSIGNHAFYGCSSLTSITIPDSITSIGDYTFSGCTGLTNITIPKSATSIGTGAFRYCTSLMSIIIPNGVRSLGEEAFSYCSLLADITIPDSVKYIGEKAFYNTAYYNNLDNWEDDVLYIGDCLIVSDKSYSDSYIIKDETRIIASRCFYNCTYLHNITIPSSVENICTQAFRNNYINIWYMGTSTQKESVYIPPNSGWLQFAKWNYNSCYGTDIHLYDNDCDTICNECQSVREVEPHKYFAIYFADNTKHWKECVICEVKDDYNNHVYSNACDTTCNVCQSVREVEPHDYTDATCTAPKTCKGCGITIGKANGHDYKAATCTASKTCKVCKATSGKALGHDYKAATCTAPKTCKVCGATSGKALGHKYTKVTTKAATTSKNGYILTECSVCGADKSKTTIYSAKTIKLSYTSYTYNGKTKKPSVTVKDSKGKTISSKYYTVSYASGRKYVGKYKVTVKFKGNYSGTKTLYFEINPGKTTLKKVTGASKSIKVYVNKKTTQVSGYQIQYSTSKKFTSAKTKTISSAKTTSATIKSLKAKKTYYVRVRTYKTVSGKKYYSGWSTYKSTKTK